MLLNFEHGDNKTGYFLIAKANEIGFKFCVLIISVLKVLIFQAITAALPVLPEWASCYTDTICNFENSGDGVLGHFSFFPWFEMCE